MIRINLVAEKRPVDSGQSALPARRSQEDRPRRQPDRAAGRWPTPAGATGRSTSRPSRSNATSTRRGVEEQRLIQVISEVREFEARRGRLEQRVSLIEELRRGQTAPVHILDQISRSLPDMVWLTKMTQTGLRPHDRGQLPVADVALRLRRRARALALLRASGRDHQQRGGGGHADLARTHQVRRSRQGSRCPASKSATPPAVPGAAPAAKGGGRG